MSVVSYAPLGSDEPIMVPIDLNVMYKTVLQTTRNSLEKVKKCCDGTPLHRPHFPTLSPICGNACFGQLDVYLFDHRTPVSTQQIFAYILYFI